MKNDNHVWDNKLPTAQMLGRWQPWHGGHQKLFEEIIKKNRQGQIIPALSSTNYYATAKLTTLKIAITHIAGEVLENLPVNILIKA